MKDNYTATVYINSYDGEYKQKSGNNLEELLGWLKKEEKMTSFDIEAELIDNFQNKMIEKRTCKLS